MSWLLSFGLHVGLLAFMIQAADGTSLDVGTGEDTFVVEQGIALEGVAKLGEAQEMIETVDIPPVQAMEVPKPVEKIEPDLTRVITSDQSLNTANVVTEEIEPIEEEEPATQPIKEQAPQVATLIEKSSGAAQSGGQATQLLAYKGTVRKALERSKVTPRARRTGTVLIRFTVGPSGTLISSEVEQSSGSSMLDEAAIAAIKRAAPFPPMPAEIASGPIEIRVPYRFTVR